MSDDNSDEDNEPLNCEFNTLNIFCEKKGCALMPKKGMPQAFVFCVIKYGIACFYDIKPGCAFLCKKGISEHPERCPAKR